MDCPNCRTVKLAQSMTTRGVEIDICHTCGGIWLDKGELFHFTRAPKAVADRLETAIGARKPGRKTSPRLGGLMDVIKFADVTLDYCPQSGGLWFDSRELKEVLENEKSIKLQFDPQAGKKHLAAEPAPRFWSRKKNKSQSQSRSQDQSRSQSPRTERSVKFGLLPLPNLFLHSTLTLIGLYAVMTLALVLAVQYVGAPVQVAVFGGIIWMVVNFLISPYVMDFVLRFLYRCRWVGPEQLPDHLRTFAQQVCRDNKMPLPRFGIIDDGAPQAFTYGHSPRDARIVISRGLLEILTPEEAESVVAHEIGHAVHWDILLMTLAQMVPLVLYYIYKAMLRISRQNRKKESANFGIAAAAAYVVYIVSEYVVLWFSRTREYHADRFSGTVTGNPSLLASALAKIAYGLASRNEPAEQAGKNGESGADLDAIGALGIFDAGTARSIAVAAYSPFAQGPGAVNKEALKGAMRWDLWNPWAKWFELNSTHPLIALRLQHLSNQAMHLGLEPYVVFDEARPQSYWDEFLLDFCMMMMPYLIGLHGYFAGGLVSDNPYAAWGGAAAGIGLGMYVRMLFTYQGSYFPDMSVSALLKRVKVSAIRPIPCTLSGKIIGKGVPGYILSEDFILADDTGIIFIDYRQPLAIWELWFGLLRAEGYQDREVTIKGWYRRAPVPFVEIKTITMDGQSRKNWSPLAYEVSAVAMMIAGIALVMGMIG